MNKFLKKCLQLGWARDHLNIFSMSRNWINLHRKNNRLDKFKDVQYSTKFVSAWVTFCSDPWSFFYRDLMLHHKMQNIPEGKGIRYHFKLLEFHRVVIYKIQLYTVFLKYRFLLWIRILLYFISFFIELPTCNFSTYIFYSIKDYLDLSKKNFS